MHKCIGMQSSKAEYKRWMGTRTNHKGNQIVVQFNCESNPSEGVELQLLGEVRKLFIKVISFPVWSEKKLLSNFVFALLLFSLPLNPILESIPWTAA